MDARYELAYREAVRTVDDQAKTLEAVRARAGTLFSSAGVATAVLGFAFREGAHKAPRWLVAFGLTSFLVQAIATVAIWWPTTKGRFRMDPVQIIGGWIEDDEPLDLDGMYRDLALHHGANAAHNEDLLSGFFWCYVVGLVAFAALVVALVLAVWEVT